MEGRDQVGRAAAALDGLSPLAVLGRGYSLVRKLPERTIVRSASSLATGDVVEMAFAEGSVRAKVTGDAPSRRRRTPAQSTGGS